MNASVPAEILVYGKGSRAAIGALHGVVDIGFVSVRVRKKRRADKHEPILTNQAVLDNDRKGPVGGWGSLPPW